MKVESLIEELRKLPPETEIFLRGAFYDRKARKFRGDKVIGVRALWNDGANGKENCAELSIRRLSGNPNQW